MKAVSTQAVTPIFDRHCKLLCNIISPIEGRRFFVSDLSMTELPLELWHDIIESISVCADLQSLTLVCKEMRVIALKQLYKSWTINRESQARAMVEFQNYSFQMTCPLNYVRRLDLQIELPRQCLRAFALMSSLQTLTLSEVEIHSGLFTFLKSTPVCKLIIHPSYGDTLSCLRSLPASVKSFELDFYGEYLEPEVLWSALNLSQRLTSLAFRHVTPPMLGSRFAHFRSILTNLDVDGNLQNTQALLPTLRQHALDGFPRVKRVWLRNFSSQIALHRDVYMLVMSIPSVTHLQLTQCDPRLFLVGFARHLTKLTYVWNGPFQDFDQHEQVLKLVQCVPKRYISFYTHGLSSSANHRFEKSISLLHNSSDQFP